MTHVFAFVTPTVRRDDVLERIVLVRRSGHEVENRISLAHVVESQLDICVPLVGIGHPVSRSVFVGIMARITRVIDGAVVGDGIADFGHAVVRPILERHALSELRNGLHDRRRWRRRGHGSRIIDDRSRIIAAGASTFALKSINRLLCQPSAHFTILGVGELFAGVIGIEALGEEQAPFHGTTYEIGPGDERFIILPLDGIQKIRCAVDVGRIGMTIRTCLVEEVQNVLFEYLPARGHGYGFTGRTTPRHQCQAKPQSPRKTTHMILPLVTLGMSMCPSVVAYCAMQGPFFHLVCVKENQLSSAASYAGSRRYTGWLPCCPLSRQR